MTADRRETGAPPACHFETRIGAVIHVCNRPKGHGPPHYMELFRSETAREPAHLPGPAAEILARPEHFAVVYATAAAHVPNLCAALARAEVERDRAREDARLRGQERDAMRQRLYALNRLIDDLCACTNEKQLYDVQVRARALQEMP